jgi:multidrug efflux pump subunit AcrA (membrane-fusion protein)
VTRPVSIERLKELATIAPNAALNAESAAELRALAAALLDLRHVRDDLDAARAKLRDEQGARAELRIEINALRLRFQQLQLAAPVMLTVMALLADEADLEGLREIGLWYNEQEPEHLKLWLDAEHARSAREQAKVVAGG